MAFICYAYFRGFICYAYSEAYGCCGVLHNWAQYIHVWRSNYLDDPILKKKDFVKLLKEVVDRYVTHSVLANDFLKCGLYPWDPTVPRVAGHKNGIHV